MAEMRRVQLSEGKRKGKGKEAVSSTFYFENKSYTLSGSTPLAVPMEVANAWKTADNNVVVMPER